MYRTTEVGDGARAMSDTTNNGTTNGVRERAVEVPVQPEAADAQAKPAPVEQVRPVTDADGVRATAASQQTARETDAGNKEAMMAALQAHEAKAAALQGLTPPTWSKELTLMTTFDAAGRTTRSESITETGSRPRELDGPAWAAREATVIEGFLGSKVWPTGELPEPSRQSQVQRQEWTPVGNARRMLARHGENIRYNIDTGTWLTYTGTHWKQGDTRSIMPYAIEAATTGLQEELASIPETVRDDEGKVKSNPTYVNFAKFRKNSQKTCEITGMITLASGLPAARISSDKLDRYPLCLNTPSGVVDLRNGTLALHQKPTGEIDDPRITFMGSAHTNQMFLTKLCPVAYDPRLDPEKACPRWLRMLRDAFYGDDKMVAFLQRGFGISLTTHAIKRGFFLLGPKHSGKTTILDVIAETLGADFSSKLPAQIFIKTRFENNARQLAMAKAKGRRFVYASETDARSFDAPFFKEFLSGGKQTGRAHREQWDEFQAQYTAWIDTNTLPYLKPEDDALWARILVVPFKRSYYYKGEEPTGCTDIIDEGLKDYLLKYERPGILAWAVEGAVAWHKEGGKLVVPAAVREATDAHRENCREWKEKAQADDADEAAVDEAVDRAKWTPLVSQWLEECFERGADTAIFRVAYRGLYDSLMEWLKTNTHQVQYGQIELKEPEFREILTDLGVASHVSHGKAYRLGIRPRSVDLGDIIL
jgi:putative DNA primase/helicase